MMSPVRTRADLKHPTIAPGVQRPHVEIQFVSARVRARRTLYARLSFVRTVRYSSLHVIKWVASPPYEEFLDIYTYISRTKLPTEASNIYLLSLYHSELYSRRMNVGFFGFSRATCLARSLERLHSGLLSFSYSYFCFFFCRKTRHGRSRFHNNYSYYGFFY